MVLLGLAGIRIVYTYKVILGVFLDGSDIQCFGTCRALIRGGLLDRTCHVNFLDAK